MTRWTLIMISLIVTYWVVAFIMAGMPTEGGGQRCFLYDATGMRDGSTVQWRGQ